MRPHVAPTEPTHMGAGGSVSGARVLAEACVACGKHELAIDGLTQALVHLRRGVAALREENAELRAELSRRQRPRSAARR